MSLPVKSKAGYDSSMTFDDHDLILLVTRTTKSIREATTAVLARYGAQPPQNLVLDALVAQDGLTPGELARLLQVAGPTAVKMAQRMEANGLVSRRRDDPDERLVRVYLTDRGREIQRPIAKEIRQVARTATREISPDQKLVLHAALNQMRSNLDG
jgi:MarR family transcriptional regulator, organic hydroperoxide resistance regulator